MSLSEDCGKELKQVCQYDLQRVRRTTCLNILVHDVTKTVSMSGPK